MKYFTFEELCRSQSATRFGINNRPSAQVRKNLEALVENILDPLREHFGPVTVSSGYRSPTLNARIGGAKTSQHVFGQAADISINGVADRDVAIFIRDNLPFDQVILEFPPTGWVHVSYSTRLRGETLTARKINGRTVYTKGLL
ncbi:DUF882 domain-containing protein [Erythrobacter arachoides]|uniref:DUF882 domain-containing protein n=1 Tax=Aurantiacibacter arachoides TaxID=1850444 RepID=A0A845A9M5_9SPHN|nr:D-Ala-D-Ala carboxypeptidase family metallohydrolase [Aurantiacibacter arachoides]MXO94279.1 DUF882 domain-containing protein [Aurantiacibacter arachoides]GGD64722.1 peptidase M15 [Aurantiacibacter arachoides]